MPHFERTSRIRAEWTLRDIPCQEPYAYCLPGMHDWRSPLHAASRPGLADQAAPGFGLPETGECAASLLTTDKEANRKAA